MEAQRLAVVTPVILDYHLVALSSRFSVLAPFTFDPLKTPIQILPLSLFSLFHNIIGPSTKIQLSCFLSFRTLFLGGGKSSELT